MAIERAQINRTNDAAAGAVERKPRESGGYSSTDRRMEPQGSAASLTSIPNLDDLAGFDGRLAFGFRALGGLRSSGSGTLAFLRSPVRSHAGERTWTPDR